MVPAKHFAAQPNPYSPPTFSSRQSWHLHSYSFFLARILQYYFLTFFMKEFNNNKPSNNNQIVLGSFFELYYV